MIQRPPPPPVLVLPGEPSSAGAARKFVRAYVEYHVPGVPEDYVENIVLIASEMTTNAIRYGTEPGDSIRITIDADDREARIEVQDPTRRSPRRRPESGERGRGRGLFILDAVCGDEWGCRPAPFGKVVWARVRAPQAPAPGPDFIAGLTVLTWLDFAPAGTTPWLLIGHPPPHHPTETTESIANGLRALGTALQLRPTTERVPDIGNRLRLGGRTVALDYGHDHYLLHVPDADEKWRTHIAQGNRVHLAVYLDALSVRIGIEDAARLIQHTDGRVLMGATGVRGR
ncbi:ATP-binding protein [Streptomyces acidiscabies]|uniref:ATP-binding protein n=1 Tax=Streptomyces acidiscabies TaxID=42234 RepID=UPI0009536045|nr:ATP-binding protein [Streptomyces acidiscabies]